MFKKHPVASIIGILLILWLFGGFIFGTIWFAAKFAIAIAILVGAITWIKRIFR